MSKATVEQETQDVARFIQGALAMVCHAGVNGHLAVDRVEQGTDSEGIYLPYFDVVTASGYKVRVAVTPTL